MNSEVLDEAYERLHVTGPEFGGDDWLANHGPMAAEVLVRRGHSGDVPGWVDKYSRRLTELPTASDPVTDQTWREALGDPRRIGDWIAYLTHEVEQRPWREVLVIWWPRLIPGILSAATHGVIRVGHAVRALLGGDESQAAVTELAHGLAYWAARSLSVPAAKAPAGHLDAVTALASIPRIPRQDGKVTARLVQLENLAGWTDSVAALRTPADPDDARAELSELVTAATFRYLTHGHGHPVLLVHAATAPNAVLRSLPALPRDLWASSMAAAWAASAAITAAYAPAEPAPHIVLPTAPGGSDAVATVMDRAAHNGDEHAIKFADTAVDVYERTANPDVLAAAVRATQLIGAARR